LELRSNSAQTDANPLELSLTDCGSFLHTAGANHVEQAFEALGAKDLPNLFMPKRDQFYKMDAIPILGTGKLDLRALRKMTEAAATEKVTAGAAAL
jgi:acyl-[acyl-carrier-protein]-phospholipid O-acyltransferase/long-chain-fatty-acid--[acyl-carrier-protein] ligase